MQRLGKGIRAFAPKRRGFSLVELVIVVVIIGVIAAIAVPRISRAGTAAAGNALMATLETVRKAIDAYYAEHDTYPGHEPGTRDPDDAMFINQLTQYTAFDGTTSATPGGAFLFGPYLRAPFPTNPTNNLNTVIVKATPGEADPEPGDVGWVADLSHGYFGISATAADLDRIDKTIVTRKLSEIK